MEVIAMETMSAIPIEDKVAMSLAIISRKGIKTIRTAEGLVAIYDKEVQDAEKIEVVYQVGCHRIICNSSYGLRRSDPCRDQLL